MHSMTILHDALHNKARLKPKSTSSHRDSCCLVAFYKLLHMLIHETHDFFSSPKMANSDSLKGSHPYPGDNAKRQIDVMGGWVGVFEK